MGTGWSPSSTLFVAKPAARNLRTCGQPTQRREESLRPGRSFEGQIDFSKPVEGFQAAAATHGMFGTNRTGAGAVKGQTAWKVAKGCWRRGAPRRSNVPPVGQSRDDHDAARCSSRSAGKRCRPRDGRRPGRVREPGPWSRWWRGARRFGGEVVGERRVGLRAARPQHEGRFGQNTCQLTDVEEAEPRSGSSRNQAGEGDHSLQGAT